MVLTDSVLLVPKLKVPAAAPTDLFLDNHDEVGLLLSLRVRELDNGRGDYDVVDIVPVAVVPVVIIIPTAAVVVVVIIVVTTNGHDYSSGIK